MKTIRYILTVLSLVSVLSVSAQSLAERPQPTFQSTGSAMMNSGSAYASSPVLNADGTASYNGASYAPAQAPGGPNRAGAFDDFEEDMPLGDPVLPLMIMAFIYTLIVLYRRKKIFS